jgi:hypothetical protein
MSCIKLISWPGIQAKIYLYNGKDKDNVVELDKFKQGNFNRKTIDEIKKKGSFTIISSNYNGAKKVNEIRIRNNMTGEEETGDLSNNDRFKVWTYYPNSDNSKYYRVFEDCETNLAGQPTSGISSTYGSTYPAPVGTYPTYGPPTGLKSAYQPQYQPPSQVYPYSPVGSSQQYRVNPYVNAYMTGLALHSVRPAVAGIGTTAQGLGSINQGIVDCAGNSGAGCVNLVGCGGCDGGIGGCNGACFFGGKLNKTRKNKKTKRRNKKSRRMRRKA